MRCDRRRRAVVIALLALTGCGTQDAVNEQAIAELASADTLRAGINLGNPILVAKDAASGDLRGIAPDVARELARRLGVPIQFVEYEGAAAVADAAGSGAWDVAFIGADPAREGTIAFTAPYVELPSTYLVPAGSRIASVADADAEGVRIAARPRTAYDLVLRRVLKHATLVYPDAGESDLDLVIGGRADALSGLRTVLLDTARTLPGSRVLADDFAAIQQAIGVPRQRTHAAGYLRAFVQDIKASGFVAQAIERAGVRGARVARD